MNDSNHPTNRTLWMLADNQGTVRDVINNAGGIITGGHFMYDAYGQILEGDKTLTRYLYTLSRLRRHDRLAI